MSQNAISVLLLIAAIWCSSHLNAEKICQITPVYKSTRHVVLEITVFRLSKVKEFHPNTQQVDEKQTAE
jgi:hypothetical protein